MKTWQIELNESGYKMEISEADLQEMAKFGDIPSDWGLEPDGDNIYWVSCEYALGDPQWDVPEGWPEHLPVWQERV